MQIRGQEFKIADGLLDDSYQPSVSKPLKEIKDKLDQVITKGTSYLDFRKKQLGLNYPSGLEFVLDVELALPELVDLCTSLSIAEADHIASIKKLTAFFANQWELRRKTDLAYLSAHSEHFNPAFIECAEILAEQLKTDRYRVLMPSLKVVEYECLDSKLSDRDWMPWHLILDDNEEAVIDVYRCLKTAEVDDKFYHQYLIDGIKSKKLSESERHRVINHSPLTAEYYDAIQAVLKVQKDGPSIGAMVRRLVAGLNKGGKTDGDGEEEKAGKSGHDAIKDFYVFLKVLTAAEREHLFSLTAPGLTVAPNFKIAWYRLLVRVSEEGSQFVPEDEYRVIVEELAKPENVETQVPCIELIGGNVETILNHNPSLYDMLPSNQISKQVATEIIINHRIEKELALKMALDSKDYTVTISKEHQGRWLARMLNNPDFFVALFHKGYIRNSAGYQAVLALFSEENRQQITAQLTHASQELIEGDAVALMDLEEARISKMLAHAFLLVCSDAGALLVAPVQQRIRSMIPSINDLCRALKVLPEVCRINFMTSMSFLDIRYILDRLRNNDDLIAMLKLLSLEDRAIFLRMQWVVAALRDRDIIKNPADLCQVLSLLPARIYRRRLLKDLGKAFLKTCLAERESFIAVSKHLSVKNFEFLIKYLGFDFVKGYINNDEALKAVLLGMDSKNWSILFNAFGATINNESLLVGILRELNEQDQLVLLNLMGDGPLRLIINNQAKLVSTLNATPCLAAYDRLLTQLGKDHINGCIANGGELLTMLDALPGEKRNAFLESLDSNCLRANVKNFFNNQTIFSMRTQDRDAAWSRFLNHLGGYRLYLAFQAREELVTFLKSLQETRWDAFFTTLGDIYICHLFNNSANLIAIAACFPQQLPLLLTMIGDDNILAVTRDGAGLKDFLVTLPQELAFDLLMRIGMERVSFLFKNQGERNSLFDIFGAEHRQSLEQSLMARAEIPMTLQYSSAYISPSM